MKHDVFQKAEKIDKSNKRKRIWFKVVSCLAAVVVFCTTYALIIPAITMEREVICGIEDPSHIHTEECYEKSEPETAAVLNCTPEAIVHFHTEECMDAEGNSLCSYADFVVHKHESVCYDISGNLICSFEEILVHEHTEECYETVEIQDEEGETAEVAEADIEETVVEETAEIQAHTHGDDCYMTEQGEQICELEEAESHKHDAGCYTVGEDYVCSMEEVESYAHSEECYDETGALVCQKAESEGHTHVDSCKDSSLVCLLEETEGHQHDDSCFAEQKTLVCELEETPVVEESTEPPVEEETEESEESAVQESQLVCNQPEIILHTHDESCTDENGVIMCGFIEVKEHIHDETCLPVTEISVQYEDEYVAMTVHVSNEEILPANLEVTVAPIPDEEEAYIAYVDYAVENNEGELTNLLAYQISFVVGEEEIELPKAEITAELTVRQMFEAQPEMTLMSSALDEETETTEEKTEETILAVLQNKIDGIVEGESVAIENDADETNMSVSLGTSRSFALTRSNQALPKFNIEYYANMNRIADEADSSAGELNIPVINTLRYDEDNEPGLPTESDEGGELPVNGTGVTEDVSPTKYPIYHLALEQAEGQASDVYEVAMEVRPTKIHTDWENVIYSNSITLEMLDVLRENSHYALDFIRTQSAEQLAAQETAGITGFDASYWTTYEVVSGVDVYEQFYLTNNPDSGEVAGKKPILITEGMTLRYVYNPTIEEKEPISAAFFDYDISDGNHTQSGSTVTMNTGLKGINSDSNYRNGTANGTHLGFGNANTGTGLGERNSSTENVLDWERWWDSKGVLNTINQANRKATKGNATRNGSYKFCTFGLVTGYDYETGKLTYADGILAPYLFTYSDGQPVLGKTPYSNSSLQFTRYGDTHTLTGVTGTDGISASRLNYFTKASGLITNNFWPMDNLSTSGHDIKFGDTASFNAGTKRYLGRTSGTLPLSDDGIAHNSYFGLQFAVDFSLDGTYTGPLEYLFYGDDDMWVFLTDRTDPENPRTRLVCDIGGVHSSVGSYTDLWDWVPNTEERPYGKGDYTLTFFYTERGASGSSCFMQFTIPDAITVPVTDVGSGSLRVGKELAEDSYNITTNQSFVFAYEFSMENNFFPYTIFNKDNEVVNEGSVLGKGNFELKAGEYIIISDIPFGTSYKVSEAAGDYTSQWKENGVVLDTNEPDGIIDESNSAVYLNCMNQLSHLILTKNIETPDNSAITQEFEFTVQLKDSAGNAITGSYNVIKTDSAAQETSGTLVFDQEGKATVTLKKYESIKIYNLPNNTQWNILETAVDGFHAEYTIVDGVESSERTVSGTAADGTLQAGDNSVICLNMSTYRLPETGGSGTTSYTIGGLAMITVATAFWYKSKRRKEDLASS